MAILNELNNEEQKEWDEWVATRPPVIQAMCKKFPPNRLYRLKTSGHRVTLYSYYEDGTLTVVVSGEYNQISFPRKVFGIKQDDIEECDLPASDEPVGALFTEQKDINVYINATREDVLAGRRDIDG